MLKWQVFSVTSPNNYRNLALLNLNGMEPYLM